MKTKVIVLLCLCSSMTLFGQLELSQYKNTIVPASPTTAALGEYGFSPIDLSTGQVNLSIPIYTIQGQSISLPISFSYRAGVKIKETSPYTGHGWSLFAGGVITRSINGAVDPTPRVPNSILTTGWTDEEAFDVYQKDIDAAPDTFSYNFMGYTGQFALEDDFVTPYYIKEQRNWLMDVDFNGDITIVTEDGTKYIFGAIETTSIDDDFHYFGDDVKVGWYLTEIISPTNNEKIVLSYYTEDLAKPILKNNTLQLSLSSKTSSVIPEDDKYIDFHPKRLSEAVLYKDNIPVSKVTFEANTLRSDLLGLGNKYALSKISIFNDPNSTQAVKYFDIDIDNVNNDRLFLRSIQEFSGDGNTSKPPYEFEYINESLLPNRLTYKADHWGYYSQQNGTEFPYTDKAKWRFAPSKEPSSTSDYGSLSKVTFPTGGYNMFDYENNECSIEDWDYTTKELKLLWLGSSWHKNNVPSSSQETLNFSLPTNQFVKLDMTLALEKGANRNESTLINEISDYSISIMNTGTNQEVFSVYFDYDPGSDDGIAMYVGASSFVSYKNLNQELYGDDPNDVPQPQANILDFHSGYALPWPYSSSANLSAYNYYDEFLDSNLDNSAITIGESLDRFLYLDLPAGNYTAILNTSTIDNDMVNQSEVSIKIEHHNGNLTQQNRIVGGIRVDSQTIATADNVETINYDYVMHSNDGGRTTQSSGQITEEPIIALYTPSANFVTYYQEFDNNVFVWRKQKSPLDPSSLWARVGGDSPEGTVNLDSHIEVGGHTFSIKSEPFLLQNSWVSYKEVSVINGNKTATGFTLHKFHDLMPTYQIFYNTFSIHDGTSTFGFRKYGGSSASVQRAWPFTQLLETSSKFSRPESILRYKYTNGVSYVLVEEEKYEYYDWVKTRLLNSTVQTVNHVAFAGTTYFERQYSLLKSKETIKYDSQGQNQVSSKILYGYNDDYFMPNKLTATTSMGDTKVKKIKYPFEYTNNNFGFGSTLSIQDLKNRNMLIPIEEQLWELDSGIPKLLGGRLNIYDKVSTLSNPNELYQPIEILSLDTGSHQSQSSLTNEYNDTSYGDIDWSQNVSSYDYGDQGVEIDYDSDGNIIEEKSKNGATTSYLWGYDKQYPVAKIENATRSQIAGLSGFSTNFNAGSGGLTTTQENTLRNGLTNAMVTTYTYDPLVGITSITDPKGNTVYYEYDHLNRLEFIKDRDGNLVSENKYNYKN